MDDGDYYQDLLSKSEARAEAAEAKVKTLRGALALIMVTAGDSEEMRRLAELALTKSKEEPNA